MEFLLGLLILLIASRLGGELVQRVGQPALLGELLAGAGLGLVALSLPENVLDLTHLPEREGFKVITDLGIFFLMFLAGLEMEPQGLIRASGAGLVVAVGGVVVPLALGLAIGFAFLPESEIQFVQAFFLGIALSITAVAVSTKVLMDLGFLETRLGQVIISAAVIDDVIAMIFLAVLTSIAKTGEVPSLARVFFLGFKAAVFFGLAFLLGRYVFHRLKSTLESFVSDEIAFTVAVAIALFFAVLSEFLGMHFLIGAFVGGLFIHVGTVGEKRFQKVLDRASGITFGFLSPVFFASIGLQLDLSSLGNVPLFVSLLILAAIVGKLGGCGLVAKFMGFSIRESLAIGTAMNGRGAVELILAAIAIEFGLFEKPSPAPPIITAMYSSVVVMAFLTTVITPIGLKAFLSPLKKVS